MFLPWSIVPVVGGVTALSLGVFMSGKVSSLARFETTLFGMTVLRASYQIISYAVSKHTVKPMVLEVEESLNLDSELSSSAELAQRHVQLAC